jgi:hypothetical protein
MEQAATPPLSPEAGGTAETHPSLVTSAATALTVVAGSVDLFWVEVRDGAPFGARRHVMRVEAGGVVFGVPLAARKAGGWCGFMTVAGPDAQVVAAPRAILWNKERALVAPLVDRWICGLARTAFGPAAARRHVVAQPAEHSRLAAHTAVRAAPRSVAWLRVRDGSVLSSLHGVAIEHAGLMFPVTEDVEATAQCDSVVACLTTELALATSVGEFEAAFDRFNRRALVELGQRYVTADAIAIQRQEQRRRARDNTFSAASSGVAGAAAEGAAQGAAGDDPLISALRRVAGELGIAFAPTADATGADTPPERLLRIAAAANLRWRRVTLRGNWWRHETARSWRSRSLASPPSRSCRSAAIAPAWSMSRADQRGWSMRRRAASSPARPSRSTGHCPQPLSGSAIWSRSAARRRARIGGAASSPASPSAPWASCCRSPSPPCSTASCPTAKPPA